MNCKQKDDNDDDDDLFGIHLLGCSCAVRVSLTGGGFRLRFPTFEITIVRLFGCVVPTDT